MESSEEVSDEVQRSFRGIGGLAGDSSDEEKIDWRLSSGD